MKEGFYVAMDTETVYSKKEGYCVNKMTVRQYVEHPKFRCYLVSLAIEPSVAGKFGVDVNDPQFSYWEPVHEVFLSKNIPGYEDVGGDVDKVKGHRCVICAFPSRWYMGDGSKVRMVAFIDKNELNDVPTRTYKYGGTGYGEAEGNGDSGLEYIQRLFNRNK